MATPDRTSDRLYDIGFFLVEAFASMEVTAVLIANARIAATLGIRDELTSFILNSYLYPLFAGMIIALALSRWIARNVPPMPYFISGLLVFSLGNILCSVAIMPATFFAGRMVMGLGAGVAFAGQIWTLSSFHYERITRPLVWGEIGAALGVVAGPMVGALFASHSPEGWRHFFTLNAGMGLLTAVFAYAGLRGRKQVEIEPSGLPDGEASRRLMRTMTAYQVAVSILIVGAEYFFSDHLQHKAGKSPMFVGAMTVMASVGAVVGSLLAAHWVHLRNRIPVWSTLGLLGSLAAIAGCLGMGQFLLAGVPIFTAGLGMGMASVSIYTAIVKASRPDQFLSRSMIYLIAMQLGNALGVQAVGLSEIRHFGILATALTLATVPTVIAIWAHFQGSLEPIAVPVIAPLGEAE